MQREIKFRAWDMDNKIMSKPFGLMHGEELLSDMHIIMQYTCLKDKNGKEIYEGDIVRVDNEDHGPEIRLVEWLVGNVCEGESAGFTIISGDVYEYEVIGNIYEHPELLKT
jgi:hypothetical protein